MHGLSQHVHLPWYCWRRAQGDNLEVYWRFWERLSAPSALPLLARELWNHLCCKERTPWRGEERASLASLGGVCISPAQCCSCSLHRRGWYWRRLEATTEGRKDIQAAGERVYNSFPSFDSLLFFSFRQFLQATHPRAEANGKLCGCHSAPFPRSSNRFQFLSGLEDGKGVSDSETDDGQGLNWARTKLGKNEAESWLQL